MRVNSPTRRLLSSSNTEGIIAAILRYIETEGGIVLTTEDNVRLEVEHW